LTPFAAILGGPLTQKKEKLEKRGLSCQSFSEINWRSADSVVNPFRRFYESPRRIGMERINTYNNWLKSKNSLENLKTNSGFHSGLDKSIQAKK
jgi:hypothetical protein